MVVPGGQDSFGIISRSSQKAGPAKPWPTSTPSPSPLSKSKSYKAVWLPSHWGSHQDSDWYFPVCLPISSSSVLLTASQQFQEQEPIFPSKENSAKTLPSKEKWWGGGVGAEEQGSFAKEFQKARTYWVVSFNLWVVCPSPSNSWLSGPKYSWLKISWRSPERVL